jgi:YHS domain-containing protein
MLKKLFYTMIAACLVFTACKSGADKTETKPAGDTSVAMQPDSTANAFEHLLVDNKKDPGCGMPVSAGISDTAHYKGKVLGFCSKECKAVFEKDPEHLIAAAEIK